MKLNIIYTFLLISNSFFTYIKSEDSSFSLLDMNFSAIDDNILKSFNNDFEFSKDKQDIISIQQKMKKVACLNIITKVIKESKSDIKNQIKSAKAQNKNNFNKFIHDMTNTCINIIKEKEVKQILNIENFENKNFPLGKKEIQFDEHLARFIEDNEIVKKIEEIIELKKQRKKMIINTTCIAIIVLIIFYMCYIIRKIKKGKNDFDNKDKKEKKSGNKKKGKKIEKEN